MATYVLDRYDAAADRWEPLVAVTKARVEAVTIYIYVQEAVTSSDAHYMHCT